MDQRAVCAGCQRQIRDRFLLRVTDCLWHEACVRCAACGDALRTSCFVRGHKLYCKRDYADFSTKLRVHLIQKQDLSLCVSTGQQPLYQRLFAVHCGGCAEAISHTELVMRVGAAVFHMHCFTCSVCSCRLQTGDRCVFREGQLLCAREDYHRCLASPTSSYTGDGDDEDEEEEEEEKEEEEEESAGAADRNSRAAEQDSKRPKRPRTILTTQQRRTFKASFEVSSKPCRKVRETLAAETGLSVRVVQVWFQNQRAKIKKLARRQQQQQQQQQQEQQQQTQEQSKHSSHLIAPSCGRLTSNMDCLGSSYTQTQQHQQQMGLTTVEQPDYDMDPFRQGLTPPQMPGDHMHPYGIKDLYSDTDPLCHLTDSDCLPLGDSSLLTPIDRLYSMQDSYFTS